jgi:pimeloyl-ACP methyl ester carboxylesterase
MALGQGAIRRLIALLLGAVAVYFALTAYVLHFEMDRVLFPRTPAFKGPAVSTASFRGKSGSELLVRRYGEAQAGCVLFFPGQHGALASYDFADHVAAGLGVYLIAYPGQGGAAGPAALDEIEQLAGEAAAAVLRQCQPHRTVFVGVSLGSMLAARATRPLQPAGLVLLSAAPSLSSAIRVRLRARLVTAPLGWLPVSKLVPHDYSLHESLLRSPAMPVVVFQGLEDEQTPIELLRSADIFHGALHLVGVAGATHSTTFTLSGEARLATVLALLRGQAVCELPILALQCDSHTGQAAEAIHDH